MPRIRARVRTTVGTSAFSKFSVTIRAGGGGAGSAGGCVSTGGAGGGASAGCAAANVTPWGRSAGGGVNVSPRGADAGGRAGALFSAASRATAPQPTVEPSKSAMTRTRHRCHVLTLDEKDAVIAIGPH